MMRAEDPRIDLIAVVPPGPDTIGIDSDHTMYNFGAIFRRKENDNISSSNFLLIVGRYVKSIPGFQSRVHARADVGHCF